MKAEALYAFLKKTKLIFVMISIILLLFIYFFISGKTEPQQRNTIFIFSAIAFIVLDILVVCRINETLTLSILLAGLMAAYFIVCPVGMAPDEEAHFYRAYEISQGDLLSKHISADGSGGNIFPNAMRNFRDPETVIDTNDTSDFVFSNTSLYSPVSYAPQAIAIRIADIFTDRPYDLFVAGRFGGAVFAFVLCVLALCFVPFDRRLLFLIMTFPLTLQEMISMSPDGVLIALSLFFTSYALYIVIKKKRVDTADMIIIAAAAWMLALNKIVYVVFCLLVFMIPKEFFKSRKQAAAFRMTVILVAVILNIGWLAIASGYLVEFRPGVNPQEQVRLILGNPVRFLAVAVDTITESPYWVPNMIGAGMGANDIPTHPLIWMMILILIVYETCDTIPYTKEIPYSVPIILIIVFLGVSAITFTSLYVQWTEVGMPVIVGIQGRYFTPVLICLLYAISIIRTKHEGLSRLNPETERPYYPAVFMLFCNIEILAEICIHYLNR